jgi:anti-sigma factor RsiW
MRHERASDRLSDYLDGSLSAREAARVEMHLLGCERCRRTLAELGRTVDLLRSLRGSVQAPDLTGAVMARIRAGEAEPSVFDRVRAGVSRFIQGPLGAPLATATVGLALLALLPRIEVEVSIPGRAPSSAQTPAPAPELTSRRGPQPVERLRAANPPLLARRVGESLSSDPFACQRSPSPQACRDHHASMTRLARQNPWAFMARVEAVPEPRRDDWLNELSRFAAESGAASEVAAQLRATGDPDARRMATHFERAR